MAMKEEELPWWKKREYVKYNIDGSQDYWLPPIDLDPVKLRPRRLNRDEYDEMRTALDTLHKSAENMGPEKLNEIVGVVEVSKEELTVVDRGPPPIYRKQSHGDIWGCRECKDRGDKWYMQDHRCSRSKVLKKDWPRIKEGQRKAEHIKKVQRDNHILVGN